MPPPPLPQSSSRPTSSHASLAHNTSRRRRENSHLRPEDAYFNSSPPRSDSVTSGRRPRRNRSSSRRRTAAAAAAREQTWKKLLWVKQSFPDNYTDEETFLDHLQRNPRLRPYEFWPLVADTTIIVQHVCSVVVFVCCFTGIFQERVSPQVVVGWATLATVAGWVFRDFWQSRSTPPAADPSPTSLDTDDDDEAAFAASPTDESPDAAEFGQPFHEVRTSFTHSRNPSGVSVALSSSSPINTSSPTLPNPHFHSLLQTTKSALLIVSSLLGLSPILKSLTLSTSSDSIWALSCWLLILNVFTFDYGVAPPTEAKYPASLSTNAALMASTVLASRLPNTIHVFSLTLFSIEVFGLFPVFRRHLRHTSWTGHMWLTAMLVVLASGGLSMTISGGGWAMGVVGVVLGGVITALIMGVTSWWLIGLQRYKNEIRGPWDPARPVIRRGHWD